MDTDSVLPSLNILLADDDKDDRFFFKKALDDLPIPTYLETVQNGEELMEYLIRHHKKLPDVLFLDLNMPRKSGAECLSQIKKNPKIQSLPVIIYSTSLYEDVAEHLFFIGAHYYIRKTDFTPLKALLLHVLQKLVTDKFQRPPEHEFIVMQHTL